MIPFLLRLSFFVIGIALLSLSLLFAYSGATSTALHDLLQNRIGVDLRASDSWQRDSASLESVFAAYESYLAQLPTIAMLCLMTSGSGRG